MKRISAQKTSMGALTSKGISFVLRDWDAKNLVTIDPTDSFGTRVTVYFRNKKIIYIEPFYTSHVNKIWLTDKGRRFFDSIKKIKSDASSKSTTHFTSFLKDITLKLYTSDYAIANTCQKKRQYFTIIFDNLGLSSISFLKILLKNYSFLKIRKADPNEIPHDLENHFQLNTTTQNISKLNMSTFCLLIGCCVRYEGYFLNLNLKKRDALGNFKCFVIGSIINSTFDTRYLGANTATLTRISQGTHAACQELSTRIKPLIIFNTEFFKTKTRTTFLKVLEIFKFSNVLTKTWTGVNVLTQSLYENGFENIHKFAQVKLVDLANFSFLYFININTNNVDYLKKILRLKLLQFLVKKNDVLPKQVLFQTVSQKISLLPFNMHKKFTRVETLISRNFYELNESYITTEGVFCSTPIVNAAEPNSNEIWQTFREFQASLKKHSFFLSDAKNNTLENANFDSISTFKNYSDFLFFATINLTPTLLEKTTNSFFFYNTAASFSSKHQKVFHQKFIYWLNSFFTGGKDEYSIDSITMQRCEKNLKMLNGTFV